MGMKIIRDVTLQCDDGYNAEFIVVTDRKENLTILQRFLAYGHFSDEKVHVEDTVVDLVDLFKPEGEP